jgi:hypothetical protein
MLGERMQKRREKGGVGGKRRGGRERGGGSEGRDGEEGRDW